jgi:hypothetical protein
MGSTTKISHPMYANNTKFEKTSQSETLLSPPSQPVIKI